MTRRHETWDTTGMEDTFASYSRVMHPGGHLCQAIASWCTCSLLMDHEGAHRCACGAAWFWYRPETPGGRKGRGILVMDRLPDGQLPAAAQGTG